MHIGPLRYFRGVRGIARQGRGRSRLGESGSTVRTGTLVFPCFPCLRNRQGSATLTPRPIETADWPSLPGGTDVLGVPVCLHLKGSCAGPSHDSSLVLLFTQPQPLTFTSSTQPFLLHLTTISLAHLPFRTLSLPPLPSYGHFVRLPITISSFFPLIQTHSTNHSMLSRLPY